MQILKNYINNLSINKTIKNINKYVKTKDSYLYFKNTYIRDNVKIYLYLFNQLLKNDFKEYYKKNKLYIKHYDNYYINYEYRDSLENININISNDILHEKKISYIIILFDESFSKYFIFKKPLKKYDITTQLDYDLNYIYCLDKFKYFYNVLKKEYKNIIFYKNKIKIQCDIIPKYYISNNTINYRKIINKKINKIKNIEIIFNNKFELISVNIDDIKHPNCDNNGNFCIGNLKYKILTEELIHGIIYNISIYNFNNCYKIPESFKKYI